MILHLDQTNFHREVEEYPGVALVEFWAPWWKPCRMLAPIVEGLSQSYDGRAKVAKVNIDENNNLAMRFSVRGLPTILLFSSGVMQESLSGALSGEQIEEALQRTLRK